MSYPDAHLQSAIRGDERRFVFRLSSDKCPSYLVPYLNSLPIPRESVTINSESQYGVLLGEVYNPDIEPLSWVKRYLPSAFEVSIKVVTQALKSLIPNLELPSLMADEYCTRLISTCVLWEDIRSQMQALGLIPCRWVPKKKSFSLISKYYLSGKFMIFCINDKWFVFAYDQVMMMADTIWARCNVLIYHHLLPTGLTSKVPPVYIENCYRIIDKYFLSWGNDIYDGVKAWEPLILGLLVEDYDPYDGGTEYLTPVLKEMKDMKFFFINDLYGYIKGLKLFPDQYSELHGLYRHWGHPTVDEPAACEKTRAISQHRPVPKFKTIVDSVGCLKRQYIVSFIQKHGRWPSIKHINQIKNKTLRSMVKTHARHLNLYQTSIKLSDWFNLDMGKDLEFDYHLDYTELIDDKSISPFRSEFRSLFNPTVLGYKPGKPQRSRRLLKAILEITTLDIEEIITKIRNREVPHEWFIVILHSKERELKIKPRLFAMMVLEMRMYFVVTEKNIAKSLFTYFPQQTMTLSEAELSKRIYKFTDIKSSYSFIPFYVMIDFKSWNIHWSEMSTHDAFKFVDSVFGTHGNYTFTHEFFSKCLMVLSSSLIPPSSIVGDNSRCGDPPECETLWYNHMGGWDGLRQKGWTISTIALLLLVENITGIRSQIVGQADNQICKIYIPRETNELSNAEYIKSNLSAIKNKITLFTDTLDKVVSDIGLVLKKEESLVSSVLTIYGKEMTYLGAHLSQASKKISRALSEVNTVVPSLHSKTLTIHSAGLSTSQKTHTPFIPCVLANVLSLINFINGARYSQLTRNKNSEDLWDWLEGENALTFILLGSGDTGGAPIQNILDYLYRGHPDSLTSYTTYLYKLIPTNLIAKKIYSYLQNRRYSVGDADPELLISNPCSTNIESFPLVSSRYRRKLEILVQRKTKNKDLKALFPMSSQQDDKDTFNFLLKFRPLQPRLLHEIFRLTPTCSRLTFIAKFSSTRTIHHMLAQERELAYEESDVKYLMDFNKESFIINVDDVDSGMLIHLRNTYRSVLCEEVSEFEPICPTLLAKDLRQYSWKNLIGNTPLDGVTVPHPVHQFELSFPKPGTHQGCPSSPEFCIFTTLNTDPKEILSSRGPLAPYIGSRTREKVTGKIYAISTTARPFKAAERAVILDSWCVNPQSSLHFYLMDIIKSRTDMPEEDIKRIAGRISGGTSIHRLDSHMGSTSTLNNSISNSTTHILFSTDTMGRFSRGRENYVMHFQGVIHSGLSLLTIFLAHNNVSPLLCHLHYVGSCCEELIDESLVGGFSDRPNIPCYPDNPLLYTRIQSDTGLKVETLRGISNKIHNDSAWALSFILLSRIRLRILSSQWGITETTAPTVSSLGVQEILRIGIPNIVRALAKVLYLHIDYEDEGLEMLLCSISSDIWDDLSNLVLIPDVLIPTMQYLNIDGVPDAFINPKNISRMLNRKLVQEVNNICQHPNRIKSTPPFHIYGNITLTHIIRMWGKVVYITSGGKYDLRDTINTLFKKDKGSKNDMKSLSTTLATTLLQDILAKYGSEGFVHAWKEYPLSICYNPPESLLRILPFPDPDLPERIMPYQYDTIKGDYVINLSMPPRSKIYNLEKVSYSPTDNVRQQKLRADHYYRTLGQVSTAYLKYMEIIFKDNIKLDGTGICTADGESSLGFLIYKLTGKPIIYNSLVDRSKLQPQRGYTYIPGSFLQFPHAVLNTEVNSLLGGDITNTDVQNAIIDTAKDVSPICIITCDAEASVHFSLNIVVDILKAICRLGLNCKAEAAIIKTYILDADCLAKLGGHLQTVWEDVKLVTPCYSSYESTECFWVCKSFSPTVYNMSLNIDPLDSRLIVPLSCCQVIPHMLDYLLKRKSFRTPLQQHLQGTVQSLLHNAKSLGFRDNTIQAFYSCTNNIVHYDTDYTMEVNLNRGLEKIMSFMYKYLQGVQMIYEGKVIDMDTGAMISKSRVMHTTVENHIIAYRNIIITLKISDDISDLDKVDKLIHEHSCTETPIEDATGKVLYMYKDPDEFVWRQRYLKSIWKVVRALH